MLEIRRGTAARNYENSFFREFAENLEKFFDKYSIDGLLIANSVCEISPNLQIDSLLITNSAVCLIDFKNFGEDIILPNNDMDFPDGQWVTKKGTRIKGGSHINPYKQLTQQKRAFGWVFHNSTLKASINDNNEKLNPSHANKIVCFHKPINLIGKIPGRDEIDFKIADSESYLETIKDIIDIKDEDVRISKKSFDAFKEIFRADKFNIKETYNDKITFDSSSTELNYDNLYPDQKSALQEISEFIKSESEKIFVLQGTSLSGKSYLIPFIEDIAYNNEIAQIELFASSSRVATNLLSESNLNFNSLYSYIYGGGLQETQNDDEANVNQEEEENTDKVKLEIVPLKKSDNEDKAIFIVDEAQLVSDNYHQSIDLRFGSGKLLEDFIKFSDLKNSNRKIIFIGDSFQLTIGKKEESTLNPEYLKEKYELETKAFQLIDKEDKSLIVKQALMAVNGIRNQSFNQLSFEFSENLKSLDKEEILPILKNRIEDNSNFHLLSYSNADAQRVNYWIKKAIIKNGDDIAQKDLIIFNNNFRVEDANDPFAEPKKVFNGQFGSVTKVDSEIIPEIITPKGKQPITLKYREISLILKDTGHNATVLSLENYRLSEKGEVSEDEIIALKIILNREIKIELNKNPFEKSEVFNELQQSKEYKELAEEIKSLQERLNNGEKVKTKLEETERKQRKILNSAKRKHRKLFENKLNKDTSSKYYKYKNAAQLRFGWALTVHKSMSYKWDEILFNVDQGENRGKTNEDYFKWIYTGLTRTKDKVSIINYKDINPFFKLNDENLKDHNSGNRPDDKILFKSNTDAVIQNTDSSIIEKYNFPNNNQVNILLQIFYFINSKLSGQGFEIKSITHNRNQEVYEIINLANEVCKISIYYRDNGRVNIPTIMFSEPNEFGGKILNILVATLNINSDLSSIKDKWRQDALRQIIKKLANIHLEINYVVQSKLLDTIKISGKSSVLIVLMDYEISGFYSNIRANYFTDEKIWTDFIEVINALKGK
jgi:TATA-binding-like protein domain of the TOTE conflict systems/Nuclease-related domain